MKKSVLLVGRELHFLVLICLVLVSKETHNCLASTSTGICFNGLLPLSTSYYLRMRVSIELKINFTWFFCLQLRLDCFSEPSWDWSRLGPHQIFSATEIPGSHADSVGTYIIVTQGIICRPVRAHPESGPQISSTFVFSNIKGHVLLQFQCFHINC